VEQNSWHWFALRDSALSGDGASGVGERGAGDDFAGFRESVLEATIYESAVGDEIVVGRLLQSDCCSLDSSRLWLLLPQYAKSDSRPSDR
jgi:hypothetical protein